MQQLNKVITGVQARLRSDGRVEVISGPTKPKLSRTTLYCYRSKFLGSISSKFLPFICSFHSTPERACRRECNDHSFLLPFPANGFGFERVRAYIGLSGLGLALALENLDTRVYSSQQLENFTHLPVLATVPSGALPVNSLEDETSPRIGRLKDAYRLLASNLYTLKEQMPLQTVV
jgi:hypothetical protein